jgi:small subunit ribosomal protein S14
MASKAVFARMKRDQKKGPKFSSRRCSRCQITGRSRSVYRKFGVSRIVLRELALQGLVPGMRKASW